MFTHSNVRLKTSRIVTYTHKSVTAKLRPDLMSDTVSSIWLEVGFPWQKKFLVCQMYREWQLLDQDRTNSSHLVSHQLLRWTDLLDKWKRGLNSGLEVNTLGDFSIDHCNWTEPSSWESNHKIEATNNSTF